MESADIVLPFGAPEWARDRSKLWNVAELAEKRLDACVAREFEVALPAELSPSERRRLALDFAQEMADREGCAVDVAIHAPGREGDNRNHHAHMLRTTRKVEAEGLGTKLETEKAGRKRSEDLEAVRARWAEMTNERLREHGLELRIDHRSLAAQGINREPSKHLGPAASGYERRTGKPSAKRVQQEQEAAERLARAKALGELERQGKVLDRSIIDLSGDVQAALREREQLQAEREEQRRVERMTSTKLAHEIGRIRPPSVADLVEGEQAVRKATAKLEQLSAQHERGTRQEARAKEQAEQWREQHKIQAWFHDKGIGHASKLRELEEQREAGRTQWLTAAPRIEDAMLSKRNAEHEARERIWLEQTPTLAKVAELEELRREKVRQEFEQQKRWETGRNFAAMAAKREMKTSGWSDRGEQWKAAPEGLKKLIEGYNAAPEATRPAILDRILGREQVGELMAQQREHRSKDRGMEI